jgi:hypothetical protein
MFTKKQREILLDLYCEILLETLQERGYSYNEEKEIKDYFWDDIEIVIDPECLGVKNIFDILAEEDIDIRDLNFTQERIGIILNILAANNKQGLLF